MKITLDLSNRPEFAGPLAAAWAHTDPLFGWRLKKLKWLKEWNLMLAGLRRRYEALPDRPHSVFETFLRGADGYIPVIFVSAGCPVRIQTGSEFYFPANSVGRILTKYSHP